MRCSLGIRFAKGEVRIPLGAPKYDFTNMPDFSGLRLDSSMGARPNRLIDIMKMPDSAWRTPQLWRRYTILLTYCSHAPLHGTRPSDTIGLTLWLIRIADQLGFIEHLWFAGMVGIVYEAFEQLPFGSADEV